MRRAPVALAVALCSPGCFDEPSGIADPVLARTEIDITRIRRELRTTFDFARHRARTRLTRLFPASRSRKTRPCPDAEMQGGSTTVSLVVQDDRTGAKRLVPLKLSAAMTLPDLASLDRPIDWSASNAIDRGREVLRSLERASEHRYAAVYHVDYYAPPNWIRKPNRRRPEWVAGRLLGRLVVHDLEDGAAKCHASLDVVNDTSDAPLGARLKSDTRERLIVELGRALRREARPTLAKMSSTLTMPSLPHDDVTDQNK